MCRTVDFTDRVIPEPYLTEFREERVKWNRTQPVFIELVNDLLCGDYVFPRLQSLFYDTRGLITEKDTHHFLDFLRRNLHIRNVLVEGRPHKMFNKFIFMQNPSPVDFTHLQRVSIYGPFLPLLLGFSFASGQAAGDNRLLTIRNPGKTLPLTQIQLWWPQRTVHVSNAQGPVNLYLVDVLRALSSVSGETLQSLHLEIGNACLDAGDIDVIVDSFPNLSELNLCPIEPFYPSDQVRKLTRQYN